MCKEKRIHPCKVGSVPSAMGTSIPGSPQWRCTSHREGEIEWLRICAPAEVRGKRTHDVMNVGV